MTLASSCPREIDVLDLVGTGQWPGRADAGLRAHVAECHLCTDLAAVAGAMAELGEATRADARVPDAAVVWYRAQIRAREDLARRAARPLAAVPALGGLALVTVLVVVWTAGRGWLLDVWSHVSDAARTAATTGMVGLERPSNAAYWIGLLAVVWMVLVPLAFYVATLADRTPRPHRRG